MKFKIGDLVRCVWDDTGSTEFIGKEFVITDVMGNSQHPYWSTTYGAGLSDKEIVLVNKESENEMEKKIYYRVLKDLPQLEAGAILVKKSDYYEPTDDYWYTSAGEKNITERGYMHMVAITIENAPDWFERVYEVGVLGKLAFVTKEEAKKQAAKLFKQK